jgi:2-C-methyl-D-erythritol 4-phosphate cytidylyltransferase
VGDLPGGVPGGSRRRDSVSAGLRAIDDEDGFVLVHDAARPLATPDLVRRVVERLSAGDAEAVIPVVPLSDTIKRVDDGWVAETLVRTGLVAVQTPQGFKLASLRTAHAASEGEATDDSVLIERAGGSVATVAGERANLKITHSGDLALAEALLT